VALYASKQGSNLNGVWKRGRQLLIDNLQGVLVGCLKTVCGQSTSGVLRCQCCILHWGLQLGFLAAS
jgi:hypothetical protein